MSTVTSYETSQARLAGLCRQAQVDALFASWLQQSDAPAADVVAEAVRVTDLELAKAACRRCPLRQPCLAGAIERAEACGVWGGEIFERGTIIARKRPRGRPGKDRREITSP